MNNCCKTKGRYNQGSINYFNNGKLTCVGCYCINTYRGKAIDPVCPLCIQNPQIVYNDNNRLIYKNHGLRYQNKSCSSCSK